MIIWGLIAYPLTFAFFLLTTPQVFGLPNLSESERATWRDRHRGDKTVRNRCCGLYCGLTILYFAIIAITIWGVLHLSETKLATTMTDFMDADWAGNYVVIDNESATIFSRSGIKLGDLTFTTLNQKWSMGINASDENIEEIIYTNSTEYVSPITYNATCHTSNAEKSIDNCVTGGLVGQPVPYNPGQGHHAQAEFEDYFNLSIAAIDPLGTLNISTNTSDVYALASAYQGIGGKYPPLGYWYLNSSIVLQVEWSADSGRACQGLLVNLSKEYEGIGWIILGIIWEWWFQWTQQYCT
jgi:hypothetical protein